MKIALCFYGQPRSFEDGFKSIYEHILSKYDTDVFAHMWWSEDDINKILPGTHVDYTPTVDMPKKFKDLYHPKDLCIEKGIYHTTKKIYNYPDFKSKSNAYNSNVSRFKSTKKVIELKNHYELLNDFKYDFIVCTRTDVNILKFPDLEKLEKDKIYTTIDHQSDYSFNDFLWIFSEKHGIFLDMSDNLDDIYNYEELSDEDTINKSFHIFSAEELFLIQFLKSKVIKNVVKESSLKTGLINRN